MRRWARSAENQAAQWLLVSGGNPGTQIDTPITIAEFLQRMSKRNQATCVVNWYDANRRAAAPERLVFPHTRDDAATTLNQTLSPFNLQVRKVDDQHWWVGTEATYDRLTSVVWTPPLGESREAFVRSINSIMKGASRDVFRLTMDQESGRCCCYCPAMSYVNCRKSRQPWQQQSSCPRPRLDESWRDGASRPVQFSGNWAGIN